MHIWKNNGRGSSSQRIRCLNSGSQLLAVRVQDIDGKPTTEIIEELMGKKPELRFRFIQENAKLVEELDV